MPITEKSATTCPTCGAQIETSDGVGCMVCLLRVGLEETPGNDKALSPALPDGFGPYSIARHKDGSPWELGRGAMGITYRAVDASLDRPVALKIIHTDLGRRGAEVRARFMREARVAAALRHPNVATVYQFGIHEESGQCFYAMELVEGETLETRVRRTGPMDPLSALDVAQQIAEALAIAEKRGLVHRDLKPSNIMMVDAPQAGDRRVKVIDFGLAKALTEQADPMVATRDGFVGTPAFASPEQFAHGPIDTRSDIYSLGATLWFLLTGHTIFSGQTLEQIREKQRAASLPLEQLQAAGVPARVISLIAAMLALEPGARPGTRQLAARIEHCRNHIASRVRRFTLAAGAVAVILIAALFVFRGVSNRSVALAERPSQKGEAGTSNPQAREAYLKGRALWNKRELDAHKQAIEYFDRAIALDPNYAQAYAGLAETYPLIADNDPLIARSEDFSKARAAAKKAIELDPTLAEPHAALGLVAMNYEWDWSTAEREYKRAIELNPNDPTSHHWYAEYLITQGRFDESFAEIKRAHELDPNSLMIMSDTGKILFYSCRYDEAIDVFRQAQKTDPTFLPMWTGLAAGRHQWLAQIYHEKALYDEAIAEFKAGDGNGRNSWTISMMARTMAVAGRRAEAEQLFKELLEIRKRRELEPQNFIPVYIGLGEKDEVFALLEKEYEVRSTGLTSLKVNPLYDSLRSDPRFVDLMRRVHLAP